MTVWSIQTRTLMMILDTLHRQVSSPVQSSLRPPKYRILKACVWTEVLNLTTIKHLRCPPARPHRGPSIGGVYIAHYENRLIAGVTRAGTLRRRSLVTMLKKASVIQFGSDWHNTTAEERLATKKRLQDAASADDRDGNSIFSNSTGTALSPGIDPNEDGMLRRLSASATKQRHVSSQTITPASYRESANGQEEDAEQDSEMSDIAEEAAHERLSGEQAKKEKEQAPTPIKIDIMVEGIPSAPSSATNPTSTTTTQLVQM
jgi:hypothetical protein